MTEALKSHITRSFLITVVLLTVYAGILNYGFVWDHTDVIIGNRMLDSNIDR